MANVVVEIVHRVDAPGHSRSGPFARYGLPAAETVDPGRAVQQPLPSGTDRGGIGVPTSPGQRFDGRTGDSRRAQSAAATGAHVDLPCTLR